MLNINWGKINKAAELFDAGVDTLGQVPGAGLRRAGDAILGTGIYTLSQLKMMQYDDVKNIFNAEKPAISLSWIDSIEAMLGYPFDRDDPAGTQKEHKKGSSTVRPPPPTPTTTTPPCSAHTTFVLAEPRP